MSNSAPLKINALASVDQESCTNVELVECRYKWVMKNVGYVADNLQSPVFAAWKNEHNVKWKLSMAWSPQNKPMLGLHLVYVGDKSARFVWKFFVEECKEHYKYDSGDNVITWSPGHSHTVTLPYTKQQLLSAPNDMFKDNMLTIVVHITMINSIQQQTVMLTTETETSNSSLIKDMGKLLNDPEFSDVTIIVGESKIPVHKTILAMRSDAFAAMLRHELEEKKTKQIVIVDFDSCVIKEMVRYIYTGDTSKVSQMAGELLRAADKYNLEGLKNACISELYSNLTIETVIPALITADLHRVCQLKRQAIDFINAHSSAISVTDAFLDLMKHYPHLVKNIFGSQQTSG